MALLLVFLATALAEVPGQWVVGGDLEPWFGLSVALSGDTLVVGNAPGSQGGPWAFVYEERGGEWERTVTLGPEQGPRSQGGQLQVKVEVSGDLLALYSWSWPERVKLFERGRRGWSPVPFEAPQATDVDVDRGRVAVVDGGFVQLYAVERGQARATEQIALERGGVPYDVVLEGDRLAVGMPQMAGAATFSGGVATFRRGPTGWTPEVTASRPRQGLGFGHGVALWGEAVVASEPFGVHPTDSTLRWSQLLGVGSGPLPVGRHVMASTAESLDANAHYVVSGLHLVEDSPMFGGLAALRRDSGGDAVCQDLQRDQPHYGFSVALDGERVAVGSPRMDESVPGRVWVGSPCRSGDWARVSRE